MNADLKKFFQPLNLRQFAPVYFIDGEESYYLDLIVTWFENNILPPAERDFNLMVLYGKDAEWNEVVNSCRRFPMFADKQVVILKDASQLRGGSDDLKGLNALLPYMEKPSPSTIFLVEHGGKKVDGKTRFGKKIKDLAVCFFSDKIKDEKLPEWIMDYGMDTGFRIGRQEAEILASYLGGNLQKIANEIEKVRINVPGETQLTTALIHKYIGVSKEYNIFDFPQALTGNDPDKFYRMFNYFLANNRNAPMPLVTATLYGHLNRMYLAHFAKGKPDKDAAAAIGIPHWVVKDMMASLKEWPLHRVEKCLLTVAQYNTMAVGIKSNAGDKELLKEMVARLLN